MKNGRDEPYVPGSSLKGAIRTALAYRTLAQGELELDSLEGWAVDQLFRLGRNDPKNDLLKCIAVRDTNPVDPDDSLALSEIKTYSRSEGGEMRPKHWSNYAEVLRPGTTFETEITVDSQLLREMIATYGERHKAAAALGDEFTDQGVYSTIEEAFQVFGQAVTNEERRLTSEFGEVEGFYDGFESTPRIRLGFGTSYYSNTVAVALSASQRVSVQVDNRLSRGPFHEDCGGSMSHDRHHGGKLFCHRCTTGDIDPNNDDEVVEFPKTRRLVHRDGSPRYPLGWIDWTRRS
jgi:CRISPR type III-A-associated RAMP protein Csm5